MGRIAEALKRAQEERARKLEPTGGGGTNRLDRMMASVRAASQGQNNAGGEHDSCTAVPPPVPKPFQASAQPIPADKVGREVLALHDPTSTAAEKYRNVRTRLLTGNPGGSTRVYAVTSTLGREGKTITTANLGFSLAELRHLRVAVVDMDFRRRGLSRLLGAEQMPGLAEVLRGTASLAEICIPLVRDNLHFIPAGQIENAAVSDLLGGDRVSEAFKEISERFHYSLIDTPAINEVADIGLIAPLCHSALIVIRMNATPEPLLRRGVKMLQANHVAISGCILAGYNDEAAHYGDNQDFYASGG